MYAATMQKSVKLSMLWFDFIERRESLKISILKLVCSYLFLRMQVQVSNLKLHS